MAILNNNPLVGSGGNQGYNINNSLRFRSSASAYLNRTFGTGSGTISTFSAWVKRGTLGSVSPIMFVSPNGTEDAGLQFDGNNNLSFSSWNGAGGRPLGQLITTQVFRDPSAWYHIVLAIDTTQATSSNRLKLYVNGNQVTAFGTATYPSQNATHYWNLAYEHRLGRYAAAAGTNYIDGYMAEVNFIGGQALTPSDFGETDTTTGVWKPKAYTGTYGTNGFYLKFSDIATTSGSNAGLGKDFSGNTNYWTTNNISVTSGTTYDAMTDSPTLTSATVANYATLNPVDNPSSSNSLANANLTPSTAGASGWKGIRATMAFPTTGKWYYEVTLTSGTDNIFLGIVSKDASGVYHDHADTFAVKMSDCSLRPSGATATGTKAGYAVGDVFGVAIDCSTPTVQFYKNGSLNVTYTSPTFDPSKTYFPCFMGNDTGASATHNYNFGQRPFAYTPPTGYVALNTFNLPTPTILQGNKYMDATLYTGNGSTQTIVNQGQFKPDFVWVKRRDGAGQDHVLQDSNRGFSGTTKLASSSTAAENTTGGATGSEWGSVTAANSNGFSITASTNGDQVNKNTWTYVGWQWQAGQCSTSSNTSGTITSTVSVNTTAGFSIVTYTGTGANATVGHGLGVAPAMVIVKRRNSTGNWNVRHVSITAANSLYLNLTNASQSDPTVWNSTVPTSTVFSIGTDTGVNASGGTYVGYCWAEIAGFSKFGSYTGNGSTDGSFIFTNFAPKFVIIKRSSAANSWVMFDAARNTYNVTDKTLYPDASAAEETGVMSIDFLSNGFKLRSTPTEINGSGSTYIYACFASNPFKSSNAR